MGTLQLTERLFLFPDKLPQSSNSARQGSPKFGEVGEVEAPSDAWCGSHHHSSVRRNWREDTLRKRECQQIPLLVASNFGFRNKHVLAIEKSR
jgi:hypothetical protein